MPSTTAAAKIVVCDGNIRCVTVRFSLFFFFFLIQVLVSSTFHGCADKPTGTMTAAKAGRAGFCLLNDIVYIPHKYTVYKYI